MWDTHTKTDIIVVVSNVVVVAVSATHVVIVVVERTATKHTRIHQSCPEPSAEQTP